MIGGQIVPTHAMANQLPLSQDVLWTQRSPVICSICLSRLVRLLKQDHILSVALEECEEAAPLAG